jgi:uncharacterized protein
LKRILLISDTHGYFEPALLKHIDESDEVWHAGDIGSLELCNKLESLKPFRAVHGNIDSHEIRKNYPETLAFKCEGVKVLMLHIGSYPGKYSKSLKDLLLKEAPQLFICGHSHILKVMYDHELKLLYINPGACGREGFHQVKTALRFELDAGEIKNLAVIEFGKRSTLTS